MLRGQIVQINDRSMKIGIQGNFGTLITKRSGPTLDFAQEGRYLQSKMTDLEIFNLRYNLTSSAPECTFVTLMIFS